MPTWNREQLYAEVWEQPARKVAKKYQISDVMLGKICRKLKIPLPGRGYWAKKQFCHPVKQTPLPKVKEVPVMEYYERPARAEETKPVEPEPEPTDPQYLLIRDVESRGLTVETEAKRHKTIVVAERVLHRARVDEKGMLKAPWDTSCLDLYVSKNSLERALNLLNAIFSTLETQKFSINIKTGKHGTTANIFGHEVPFSLVEKYTQKRRQPIEGKPSSAYPAFEYSPSGVLEFRIGEDRWAGTKYRDSKKQRLEDILPTLVGALMRDGRHRVFQAERERLEAIEKRKKDIERMELGEKIREEEGKVKQLEGWLDAWLRARQMREFIAELERVWTQDGHDLSAEAEKGKRIRWMKDQADRLDPMVESPPSILDRKLHG